MSEEDVRVERLAGRVRIWRSAVRRGEALDASSRAAPDDRIGSMGEVARLSIESEVVVTLRGVEAGEREGLSVRREGKKILLRLYRGSLVVESFETDVRLETPNAKVEGKAVYFLVEVRDGSTRVAVVDGEVTVSNGEGRVELAGGEYSSTRGNRAPGKPAPADVEKESAWAAGLDAPANVIKNPGFEEGWKEWSALPYKGKPLAVVDAGVARGGRKSARMDFPSVKLGVDTDSGWGFVPLHQSHSGVLKPGARYFLRAWIRTQDYAVGGKAAPLAVSVAFENVQEPRNKFDGTCPPCEGKWRCARFFFTAKGPDVRLWIGSASQGLVSGTVWVDEIFLGLVSEGDGK